jgi:hypothetical protein
MEADKRKEQDYFCIPEFAEELPFPVATLIKFMKTIYLKPSLLCLRFTQLQLQRGIDFFHRPKPALFCACLAASLPSATAEQYRPTTFRSNKRIGLPACRQVYVRFFLHRGAEPL